MSLRRGLGRDAGERPALGARPRVAGALSQWTRRSRWLGAAGRYALLTLLALAFLAPTLWMVANSFKPSHLVLYHADRLSTFIPTPFTLKNYVNVFREAPFGLYLATSVGYIAVIIPIGLVVDGMMAYALARLRFPGRGWITALVIALIIVPFETVVIPLFLEVAAWGWINTYQVMVVPFLANALVVFFLRQSFLQFPRELEEAAAMDGSSIWRTFWTIVVPNSKAALATGAFLIFLDRWNDFLWPFIATTDVRYRNVQVGLQTFFTTPPLHWGDIMAAAVVVMVPVYVGFLFFEKYLVQGIASTGIKG